MSLFLPDLQKLFLQATVEVIYWRCSLIKWIKSSLAAMPGQDVEVGQGLLQELRDFIYAMFAQFPDVCVRVGRLLPREAALHHIQACRET